MRLKLPRRSSTAYSVIVVLIILCATLVVAVRQIQKYGKPAAQPPHCGNAYGNTDMYGIGIRIATYVQVVLVLFMDMKCTNPEIPKSLATSNIWFLIAYITTVLVMMREPSTQALDLYVVIILGNGLTLLMLRPKHPKVEFTNYETHLTQLFRSFVYTLWRVCTSTYWWKELPESGAKEGECEYYGYLIVRMVLANGSKLHTFHKVLNILGWASGCFFLIQSIRRIIIVFRLVFWALPKNGRGPRMNDNIPSRYRIFLDSLVTFPIGDLDHVIFGWEGTESDNSTEHSPSPGMQSDTEVVEERFFNYIISKYELPSDLLCSINPRRTFSTKQRLARLFGKTIKHEGLPNPDDNRIPYAFLSIHVYILLTIIIIPVEFTIVVNNIPNVNDIFKTGQLLALLASIGVCISIAMKVLTGRRRKRFERRPTGFPVDLSVPSAGGPLQ